VEENYREGRVMNDTKERPILFSAEMVKAILREDSPKTMTRRVVKPQPELGPGVMKTPLLRQIGTACWYWKDEWWWQDPQQSAIDKCPYGKPGDRMWVKETFWIEHDSDSSDYHVFDCGINIKENTWAKVQYCATPKNPDKPDQAGEWWTRNWNQNGPIDDGEREWVEWRFYSKKPSIFMPRWASRIILEITDVRVERLHQITEQDAIKEGVQSRDNFKDLWDAINLARGHGWDQNDWVWVISFRRVNQCSD
jgi:hypothetical protein